MNIEVHLLEQSQPIIYKKVENAYTKGGMYCVLISGVVSKFPLCNIFRVKETYKEAQ
jgi:hypothetical protein